MNIPDPIKNFPGVRRLFPILSAPLAATLRRVLREDARNIERERYRRSLAQTVDYVEAHMAAMPSFSDRYDLLAHALQQVEVQGDYLEFGVWQGRSARFVAGRIAATYYGFDSFEGLPSNWRDGFGRGKFAVPRLPDVPKNVILKQGWFEETLPNFLQQQQAPWAFVHIDCDLYESTQTIFTLAASRFVAGTVIVFDEYFNYPGWHEGEYKAFQEFCRTHAIDYEYLGYCRYHAQVAVKLKKVGSASR